MDGILVLADSISGVYEEEAWLFVFGVTILLLRRQTKSSPKYKLFIAKENLTFCWSCESQCDPVGPFVEKKANEQNQVAWFSPELGVN